MQLPQSANPTHASNRLSTLDMVRGFALLGIGIENLFTIHTQNADFIGYAAQYPNGLNHWLLLGLMVLIRSKFYPIFSFVFGVSAALSVPRQGTAYFLRRVGVLLGLGLLQVAFIWDGDVLTQYAFMSLLLLLVRPLPNKLLFLIAAVLLIFSFTGDIWLPANASNISDLDQRAALVYETGSFWEVTPVRWESYFTGTFTWPSLLFVSRIFAFLLMGFAFARAGGLQLWERKRWVWQTCSGLGFLVVLIALIFQTAELRGQAELSLMLLWVKQLGFALYFFCLVGAYLLFPVLLTFWAPVQKILRPLGWMGQHTLTHYLIQNLLFSLLFYQYGAGLYGDLTPVQGVLLYILLLGVQFCISARWVRVGKRGPIESFLRKLAGKKE